MIDFNPKMDKNEGSLAKLYFNAGWNAGWSGWKKSEI